MNASHAAGEKPIRVLLVDDHTVLRQGLAQMLDAQPDLTVVAQAASGTEALARSQETQPDVILLDIHMPGMDGIETTRRLKSFCPQARILILTMYRNEALIYQAVQAGASGYLLKEAEMSELVNGIRLVARGEAVLDPAITPQILNHLRGRGEAASQSVALQPDEIELLRLLAMGWSNRAIAGQLGVAEKTVRNRLTRLFRKLGVENRTAAARYAIQQGISDVNES